MKKEKTYRDYLTQRIGELLDEIKKIHDLCEVKLEATEKIIDAEERLKKLHDINHYLNKAEHLHFEAYMLDEVRTLITKQDYKTT